MEHLVCIPTKPGRKRVVEWGGCDICPLYYLWLVVPLVEVGVESSITGAGHGADDGDNRKNFKLVDILICLI